MGRPKHDCWKHVTKVENENKWICNYCRIKFSGGASRIIQHLGLGGIEAQQGHKRVGDIRLCLNYCGNEGVHNNMASTLSHPQEAVTNRVYSTQNQGEEVRNNMASTSSHLPEVVNNKVYSTQDQGEGVHNNMTSTSSHPLESVTNKVYSTKYQGVNGGGNSGVFESEINQLKQLVHDLDCEEDDIAKQLQWLESRGKKRKLNVNVWLRQLQEMKGSMYDMNNLNDTRDASELIKNMKRHKEEKPLTLSTEFVGGKLDEDIRRVLKLLADDKVFVIGICGMGGVGKTLLATLVKNEVKREETFNDVFWVTVSHNSSILKLQYDVAKIIGVQIDEDDEKIRAENLTTEWEKKEKSVLILDDVWKYIDLQKVGIHPKVNGIKVILTTRLNHVCHQMDCQTYVIIQMFPLCCLKKVEPEDEVHEDDVDEDWELFMLKLGYDETPSTLPHEIEETARCIVERFKGLPLGIDVMARTMNGVDYQRKRN